MSKEYEIKPKMVQEQWLQLQMTFLLGYNLKRLFSRDELTFGGKGINIWLGGRSLLGGGVEFFQLEEESANFWLVRNPPPPISPSRENPAHHHDHTMLYPMQPCLIRKSKVPRFTSVQQNWSNTTLINLPSLLQK